MTSNSEPTATDALDSAVTAPVGAFLQALDLSIKEVTTTRVTGTMKLGAEHHTPWGIVHGGVYASAVESAASIGASHAVRESGQIAVGLTNTTHFLRPMTAGAVRVEAHALNQGRSQQLWKVSIVDDHGRLIASGDVRLQNIDPAGRVVG